MKILINWPNRLTILRILLVPLLIILLSSNSRLLALITFCLAGLTDALDGFLARAFNQRTELGTFLDPLADKFLLISSYITLSALGEMPFPLAVLVVSRDVIILSGLAVLYLINNYLEIAPTRLGKLTTLLQLITVLAVLVQPFVHGGLAGVVNPLIWATAAATIASGFHYVYIGSTMLNGNRLAN